MNFKKHLIAGLLAITSSIAIGTPDLDPPSNIFAPPLDDDGAFRVTWDKESDNDCYEYFVKINSTDNGYNAYFRTNNCDQNYWDFAGLAIGEYQIFVATEYEWSEGDDEDGDRSEFAAPINVRVVGSQELPGDPSTPFVGTTQLTQTQIDALNREYQRYFDNTSPLLMEAINNDIHTKLNEELAGRKTSLQEILEDKVVSLHAELRDKTCSVEGAIFDHVLDVIGIIDDIHDPLNLTDPLGIKDDILDAFRDDPLNPVGSLLGGGSSSNSWTFTGTKTELIAMGTALSNYSFLRHTGAKLLQIAETINDDHVHTVSENSNRGAAITNEDTGFAKYCRYFNDLLDSRINQDMNIIHEIVPNLTVEFSHVGAVQFSNLDIGPGIDVLDSDTLRIQIPYHSSWSIVVPVVFSVDNGLGREYVAINLRLEDLRVQLELGLQAADNGRIDFTSAQTPVINANFDIDSSLPFAPSLKEFLRLTATTAITSFIHAHAFVEPLSFPALSSSAGPLSYVKVNEYLDTAEEQSQEESLAETKAKLDKLVANELLPIGLKGEEPETSDISNLETIVSNIDAKIVSDNMNGTGVVWVDMITSASQSWHQAYAPGGEGNPGTIDSGSTCKSAGAEKNYREISSQEYTNIGSVNTAQLSHADSAIWTGTFLAAQAHRYKVTGAQDAVNNANHALDVIEKMFQIHGSTGLLARAVAPKDSLMGRAIQCRNLPEFLRPERVIDGVTWVGRQGEDGVSRDQYTGVLFGLSAAFTMIDDRTIRDRASHLIQLAADYLIRNGWTIAEDRPVFHPEMGGAPLSWAQASYQIVTILTMAEDVAPGKYTTALTEAYELLDAQWLGAAFAVIDPTNEYYGHNLFYTHLYTYLRLEKDDNRREKMIRAAKIRDYYLGHHDNAYFDLVRNLYVDQDTQAKNSKRALELLQLLLKRKHRHTLTDDEKQAINNLETMAVELPFSDNDEPVILPAYPVPPGLRNWREFFWQTSGFEPDEMKHLSTKREHPGVGISLVYWIYREQGLAALPVPAKTENATYTDFESGLGQWTQANDDTHDYLLGSGTTPSGGTGPSQAASGEGYLYLETSSGYAYDAFDHASLISPRVSGTNRYFMFDYHMYGAVMGSLHVDIDRGYGWEKSIWSISGQQQASESSAWQSARVDLSNYIGDFNIRIRAEAIGGFRGDIALDNLLITGSAVNILEPYHNPVLDYQNAKQLQNYWQRHQYINTQSGSVESSEISDDQLSAQWIFETAGEYVRIRNSMNPSEYLNNEYGELRSSRIFSGWASAQWKLIRDTAWESNTNAPVYRLQNRWKPSEYIHIENGYISSGPIESGWASARWLVHDL